MRWQEEYQIVQEEMRRVLASFEWKASWWESQAGLRDNGDVQTLSGVSAYAYKQAHITRQMAVRCATSWLPTLDKHGIKPEWAKTYPGAMALVAKIHGEEKKDNTKEDESKDNVGKEDVEEELDKEDMAEIEETPSDAESDEELYDLFEYDD